MISYYVYSKFQSRIWTCYHPSYIHREGGLPAIERADGSLEWCEFNKTHRLNGPAAMDGKHNWYYINGISYSVKDYWDYIDTMNESN